MSRTAVVIPGARFGPHTPTLAYPRFAAEARGSEIVAVEWSDPDAAASLADEERARWVARELEGVLPSGRPLLIGRSLGTYAAELAAERRLPAIWISPLLGAPAVLDGLRRRSAPALLIGGSLDPYWDRALAAEVSDRVVEIDGADHGMMRGSLRGSADALGELVTAVERFLDELDPEAWPESAH